MLVYAINLLITGSSDLGINETGLGLTASNSPLIPRYALEPVINIYLASAMPSYQQLI